jgi:IS5 family transposase
LSDPATEKQLARDLMFRRFIDLSLSESVPDHSTIWRFRNNLQKQGLYEVLFAEINNQLVKQGLMIRSGEVSNWEPLKNLALLVFSVPNFIFWLKEGVLSMSYMLFSQPLPSDFLFGFLEVPRICQIA